MLIATILAGGLEFATVSAGTLGLKITRAYGMHVVVWAVFIFYLYAYGAMRRNILGQLEIVKSQTLWKPYVKWLQNQHLRDDLQTVAGRNLVNIGLSYSSKDEYVGEEKALGAEVIMHLDLSLDEATKEKFLSSGLFTDSDQGQSWIKHTYTVSEEDLREFDLRRGFALSENEAAWLEYRLPYVGAWLLFAAGIVIYVAWLVLPESWMGQIVPLDHPMSDIEQDRSHSFRLL